MLHLTGSATLATFTSNLEVTHSLAGNLDLAPALELGAGVAFDQSVVDAKARALSKSAYVPRNSVPEPWLNLTYDQYREIRFNNKSALWRGENTPFQLQFFAPGLYFPKAIQVHSVKNGEARRVRFSLSNFEFGNKIPELPESDSLGFSGFRIHGDINGTGYPDEFTVFQGASYFRAIGRGDTYGLSGRGLALRTGDATGEEFPDFIEFWVEKPNSSNNAVVVHALLDSPSVSGAYRFVVMPGETTTMDVEATLFPRVDLTHVGISPQTSMFLFDETNRNRFDDFRPAVHDNDGLMISNGAGEMLWRPLSNPKRLQVSSFVDESPKGFGLMQRAHQLTDFADLEAHYHNRPGMWVEPGENWGRGAVTLVEIPTDREIYDNIVTYWRPRDPLRAGSEHRMTYKLHWGRNFSPEGDVSKVLNTRSGARHGGGRIVTIDFAAHDKIPTNITDLKPVVNIRNGKISKPIAQYNPATGGVRVGYTFYPGDLDAMEMRAQLMVAGKTVSEVWLYRWTK